MAKLRHERKDQYVYKLQLVGGKYHFYSIHFLSLPISAWHVATFQPVGDPDQPLEPMVGSSQYVQQEMQHQG